MFVVTDGLEDLIEIWNLQMVKNNILVLFYSLLQACLYV